MKGRVRQRSPRQLADLLLADPRRPRQAQDPAPATGSRTSSTCSRPSTCTSPGPKKKFRVRYDRIVDFEPFSDSLGLMRDAQTAKPQSFRTGDGWFAHNLAVNLAQM